MVTKKRFNFIIIMLNFETYLPRSHEVNKYRFFQIVTYLKLRRYPIFIPGLCCFRFAAPEGEVFHS